MKRESNCSSAIPWDTSPIRKATCKAASSEPKSGANCARIQAM